MLRRAFAQWGLPDRMRVDNGHPWGSRGELPSELALWLIGLGVEVVWNRPRSPRMNGVVERSQGVTQQWAEPERVADAEQLRQRLDWVVVIQREEYPAVGGRSRMEAYPALAVPRRPYRIEAEEDLWDLSRVDMFFSKGVWSRRVGRSGQVSLYGRDYWVGSGQSGRDVAVRFDAGSRQWVICDDGGRELRRHDAEQLTRERVMGLEVAHRPGGRPEG